MIVERIKMKKTLFLSIIFTLVFSGCFSVSSLNPFSTETEKEIIKKKEIEIPEDAPLWLVERRINNTISAIGYSKTKKELDKKELEFQKQKALITASQNLAKKIYLKTINLYKNYMEKLENPNVFDKDIKKFAEHISLKSLTHSKIINTWISSNDELYIQIAVDSSKVAEQIQYSSKLLFNVDKTLYQNFLSNRAKIDIIKELENNDN
mgnify:CR=1 FL=1